MLNYCFFLIYESFLKNFMIKLHEKLFFALKLTLQKRILLSLYEVLANALALPCHCVGTPLPIRWQALCNMIILFY